MRVPTRPLAVIAAVAALTLAGCGDDGNDGSSAGGGGETTASESPTAQEDSTDDNHDHGDNNGGDDNNGGGEAHEVEIEIEGGQTTPAGERITVKPGQTIRLEIDSDAADELHVHSDPEHTFDVKAADDQVFEFAIDQPGVYEMESHGSGAQIISIQVQP